jgi:hypothetical protein
MRIRTRGPLGRLLVLLPLIVLNAAGARPSTREACDRAKTRRVLFIGNSFTYFYNVPRMVEGIAASLPGPCIETSLIASGGATLIGHWQSDSVAARIRNGGWTHVVLNDQSTFGEAWFVDGMPRIGTSGQELAEFGGKFIQVIREARATPVLYAHWSDDSATPRDQQALDYAFDQLAISTKSLTIPAGRAVKRMRAEVPSVNPYNTDSHHLSRAGAYVVALTTYATIAGKSPIGATSSLRGEEIELARGIVFPDSIVSLIDLPADQAAAIQRVAARIDSEWRARSGPVAAPTLLSNELPRVPDRGEAITRERLRGRWTGPSRVIPSPPEAPTMFDVVFGEDASGDSVFVRPSPGDRMLARRAPNGMRGHADVQIDGNRVTFVARVAPAENAPVRFQAVLRGDTLVGVADFALGSAGSGYAFNSVGKFALTKQVAARATAPAQAGATTSDAAKAAHVSFAEVSAWVMKAADLVPADKYSFKPTPSIRSYGQVLAHIVDAYSYYCTKATKRETQWSDPNERGTTDKATLVPKLRQALDACQVVYSSGTGDIAQLISNVAHTNLHYGNLITYIRLLGMVPPSS